MPWRCPACSSSIRLGALEDAPLPGRIYRCNVCRLELVLSATTDQLIVAPLTPEETPKKRL
jgi:hypothetical protein